MAYALKPALSEFSEVITAGRKNCDLSLDLTDPLEKINLPNGIDVVIHTAAHFGGETAKEVSDAVNINVLGTLKLCQAAVQSNAKRFVLISSIFSSLNEKSEHYGIYALSKRQAEEVATLYCSTHSLPITILRPSQVYGNEEKYRKHQPFFYTIIDKAEKGEDIILYGSHDAQRNYIHVEDLTEIIVNVIQKKVSGVFSCTHPMDLTYSQIANAALKAFNSNATIRFLKDKPNIPDNVFERNNSLYEKINFYPSISLEQGMKKLAIYRSSKA